MAPEGVHRRIARRVVRRCHPRAAFAVEEALHVGQEGDELAVMALAEIGRIVGEFVVDAPPLVRFGAGFEELPVPPLVGAGGQRLRAAGATPGWRGTGGRDYLLRSSTDSTRPLLSLSIVPPFIPRFVTASNR
jgi:hypothetical protein